ncbi:MAG: SLC13 family permease [Phycisphaerales bacterium JB065]
MKLRRIALPLGPVLAGLVYLLCRTIVGMDHAPSAAAAVTILCAAWWCTEAIPIPATALVPFALFPFLDVLDHAQLARAYGDQFILLFLGGFMLSKAAEKSGTHLRVARGMLRLVGTSSSPRIVIGFMLATAFCSMWISNTATALIMLPAAIAVIERKPEARKFAVALLLGIAYGASIGGVTTLIGTPPNGVFASQYMKNVGVDVAFFDWLKVGIPVFVLMFTVAAFYLTRGIEPYGHFEMRERTPWTPAQKRVLAVIALVALGWITRSAPFGGWASFYADPSIDKKPLVTDATVALLGVVALFLIPSGTRNACGDRERLLDWPTAVNIPWGILILFGGGLAIASSFNETGLDQQIGLALKSVTDLPPVLVVLILCLGVTFLTEVTSNTATATLLMPILAAMAIAAGLDPATYMIPAALSCSFAFMLPVATPPNAIVFGSERITIRDMVRKGLWLNLIGAVIITAVCTVVVDRKTGIDGNRPEVSVGAVESEDAPSSTNTDGD